MEEIPAWLVQPLPANNNTLKEPIIVNGQFPDCPIEYVDNQFGELQYEQPVDDD